MNEPKLSRRAALSILGATPLATALLSACGKKTAPDSCVDVSALSAEEQTLRTAVQYTDHSSQPDKKCGQCNFYQAPADVAQCGACQVVKGPIHPDGYCTNFAKKA